MQITLHFDMRDHEYGVTVDHAGKVTHLCDLVAISPTALVDLGPIQPDELARVAEAGELAYAGNAGRFDPPTLDAIAADKGFGTIGYL